MAGQAFQSWTPVGRIVVGHPMKAMQKKEKKTGALIFNKDGTPAMQYVMLLAFPKGGTEIEALRAHFDAVAQRDFPSGEWRSPVFSSKIIDGDGVDNDGKPNSSKEGFAGHWVLRIVRNFPYAACDERNLPVTDPAKFKTGHYARVFVNVTGNGQSSGSGNTPGLYVDPSLVQWAAYGPEIQGGPDVAQLIAQAPALVLPAGASAAPLAASGQVLGTSAPGGQVQLPQHPGGYVPPPVVGQQPPPSAPAAPPAQWPPVGWFTNGVAEGSYHDGKEVLTEAQLCARLGVIRPHAAILGR